MRCFDANPHAARAVYFFDRSTGPAKMLAPGEIGVSGALVNTPTVGGIISNATVGLSSNARSRRGVSIKSSAAAFLSDKNHVGQLADAASKLNRPLLHIPDFAPRNSSRILDNRFRRELEISAINRERLVLQFGPPRRMR